MNIEVTKEVVCNNCVKSSYVVANYVRADTHSGEEYSKTIDFSKILHCNCDTIEKQVRTYFEKLPMLYSELKKTNN